MEWVHIICFIGIDNLESHNFSQYLTQTFAVLFFIHHVILHLHLLFELIHLLFEISIEIS